MANALAEATGLLGEALREIAEFDWSLYALGKVPDLSAGARAHEQLLTVRRLLRESGHVPSDMPYAVCRHIVETDELVLGLRVHAGEVTRAMGRAIESEASAVAAQDGTSRLADLLAPVVRELIRRRNRCAQDIGASDYAELTLGSLGLDAAQFEQWLGSVADGLGRCAGDAPVTGPTAETRWLLHHEQLDRRLQEAQALVTLDVGSIQEWADLVGIDAARLRRDLRTDADIRGWCLPVDRPGDVRLVLTAKENPLSLKLVLHEMGHYLHYTVPPPERWQLTAPPPIFDETMASLFESAGSHAGVPDQLGLLLARPAAEDEPLLHAAKQRQWALSALFELRAYRADGESFDMLWRQLLRAAGFAATFPHEWALDRFYIDDPLYRFNYVIGFLWSIHELSRMASHTPQGIAARVRGLGEAAYHSHWRSVLGLEDRLPEIGSLEVISHAL